MNPLTTNLQLGETLITWTGPLYVPLATYCAELKQAMVLTEEATRIFRGSKSTTVSHRSRVSEDGPSAAALSDFAVYAQKKLLLEQLAKLLQERLSRCNQQIHTLRKAAMDEQQIKEFNLTRAMQLSCRAFEVLEDALAILQDSPDESSMLTKSYQQSEAAWLASQNPAFSKRSLRPNRRGRCSPCD